MTSTPTASPSPLTPPSSPCPARPPVTPPVGSRSSQSPDPRRHRDSDGSRPMGSRVPSTSCSATASLGRRSPSTILPRPCSSTTVTGLRTSTSRGPLHHPGCLSTPLFPPRHSPPGSVGWALWINRYLLRSGYRWGSSPFGKWSSQSSYRKPQGSGPRESCLDGPGGAWED